MTRKTSVDPQLTPEDSRLIETIAASYAPAPMGPVRQAAFRRALEKRLERRRLPWGSVAVAAATAAAAVTLWLVAPQLKQPEATDVAAGDSSEAPVLYAFVDPDAYEGETLQPRDFLPDDYLALASALDLSVDEQ